MTEAPDFIWAHNERQRGYSFTAKGPQPHFDGVQFVRDDPEALVQSANVQALIAAAVLEAAGAAKKRADELRAFSPEGFGPIGGVIGVAVGIETAIRALITPDAMAALDAYRDREVAKALDGAANGCKERARQITDAVLTGLPEQARQREAMEAAHTKDYHAIRAMIPQVKP